MAYSSYDDYFRGGGGQTLEYLGVGVVLVYGTALSETNCEENNN